MKDALQRIDVLIGDTLQILDHMIVDVEYKDIRSTIINGLQEQRGKLDELSKRDGEAVSNANKMSQQLNELENFVMHLEYNMRRDYEHSTEQTIDQYEQLSLEEQMQQKEAYHDKIDYLSAVKIRENINRMNELLFQFKYPYQ